MFGGLQVIQHIADVLADMVDHHLPVVARVILQVVIVGIVVVIKLQIRAHGDVTDEFFQCGFDKFAAQRGDMLGRPLEQLFKGFVSDVRALDKDLAPDQVVQADNLNKDIVGVLLAVDGFHSRADDRGAVAQAGIVDVGMPLQRFADHAGGVGQVDEVAALFGVVLNGLGDLEHGGNGLEAHDHAAGGGGLLADQAVLERDGLVHVAAVRHAGPDGGDNEISILDGLVQIERQGDFGGHTSFGKHFLHVFAGAVQAVFINVHQAPLGNFESVAALNEHFGNVRQVGRAGTDVGQDHRVLVHTSCSPLSLFIFKQVICPWGPRPYLCTGQAWQPALPQRPGRRRYSR